MQTISKRVEFINFTKVRFTFEDILKSMRVVVTNIKDLKSGNQVDDAENLQNLEKDAKEMSYSALHVVDEIAALIIEQKQSSESKMNASSKLDLAIHETYKTLERYRAYFQRLENLTNSMINLQKQYLDQQDNESSYVDDQKNQEQAKIEKKEDIKINDKNNQNIKQFKRKIKELLKKTKNQMQNAKSRIQNYLDFTPSNKYSKLQNSKESTNEILNEERKFSNLYKIDRMSNEERLNKLIKNLDALGKSIEKKNDMLQSACPVEYLNFLYHKIDYSKEDLRTEYRKCLELKNAAIDRRLGLDIENLLNSKMQTNDQKTIDAISRIKESVVILKEKIIANSNHTKEVDNRLSVKEVKVTKVWDVPTVEKPDSTPTQKNEMERTRL